MRRRTCLLPRSPTIPSANAHQNRTSVDWSMARLVSRARAVRRSELRVDACRWFPMPSTACARTALGRERSAAIANREVQRSATRRVRHRCEGQCPECGLSFDWVVRAACCQQRVDGRAFQSRPRGGYLMEVLQGARIGRLIPTQSATGRATADRADTARAGDGVTARPGREAPVADGAVVE